MIVRTGNCTLQEILKLEGLSTDDKDEYLKNLSLKNVGSSYLEFDVDTGKTKVYKLNTETDNKTLKWYRL